MSPIGIMSNKVRIVNQENSEAKGEEFSGSVFPYADSTQFLKIIIKKYAVWEVAHRTNWLKIQQVIHPGTSMGF